MTTSPESETPAPSPRPVGPRWPGGYSSAQRAAFEKWARQPQHHLLPFDDPRYPPLLREISDPPALLFVWGDVDVLSRPQLAIVGSRKPTIDGRDNARRFAAGISAAGYVVTSGLALGIDAEAHRGTLENKGLTIAVLGTGLDNVYPSTNKKLAAQITEQGGAVISEFPLQMRSYQSNFPQRNRIISGLAHGVLVVEAAEQSGSLITARFAGEQGREVFAVPGTIHNLYARGCHRLIRQGAKLVESVDHIFEELPALVQWERQCGAITRGRAALPPLQRRLLEHIGFEAVSVDTLLQRSGVALPELYAHLMQLELGGHIVNRAGGYVLSHS